MKTPDNSFARRLHRLEQLLDGIEARWRAEREPTSGTVELYEQVWIGRTASVYGESYSSTHPTNTWLVELLHPRFSATAGFQKIDKQGTQDTVLACDPTAAWLPKGTLVAVARKRGLGPLGTGEWWIIASDAPRTQWWKLTELLYHHGHNSAKLQRWEGGKFLDVEPPVTAKVYDADNNSFVLPEEIVPCEYRLDFPDEPAAEGAPPPGRWVICGSWGNTRKAIVEAYDGISIDGSGLVKIVTDQTATAHQVVAWNDWLPNRTFLAKETRVIVEWFRTDDKGAGKWVVVSEVGSRKVAGLSFSNMVDQSGAATTGFGSSATAFYGFQFTHGNLSDVGLLANVPGLGRTHFAEVREDGAYLVHVAFLATALSPLLSATTVKENAVTSGGQTVAIYSPFQPAVKYWFRLTATINGVMRVLGPSAMIVDTWSLALSAPEQRWNAVTLFCNLRKGERISAQSGIADQFSFVNTNALIFSGQAQLIFDRVGQAIPHVTVDGNGNWKD